MPEYIDLMLARTIPGSVMCKVGSIDEAVLNVPLKRSMQVLGMKQGVDQ
jgi:hypothetical protein